jgi:hypothetical protein
VEQQQRAKWGRRLGILFAVFAVWQLAALAYPLIPSPWPPFYWALPIQGRVVDADTGTPLEGVIIAAHWELRDTGWTGSPVEQIAVMEDVTNNEGEFAFWWGRPRLRWRIGGLLRSEAPELLFFKSGYEPELCNNAFAPFSLNPFPGSDCNGKTIKLRKFQGNEKEYVEKVSRLDSDLEFAFRHDDCSWKKIPFMLVAMDQEGKRLKAKGVRTVLGGVPSSLEYRAGLANERWCGSLKNYLRSYTR